MSHFAPSRALLVAMTATTILSATALAALHSQPVKKAAPTPDSALQVADDLDAIAQARF